MERKKNKPKTKQTKRTGKTSKQTGDKDHKAKLRSEADKEAIKNAIYSPDMDEIEGGWGSGLERQLLVKRFNCIYRDYVLPVDRLKATIESVRRETRDGKHTQKKKEQMEHVIITRFLVEIRIKPQKNGGTKAYSDVELLDMYSRKHMEVPVWCLEMRNGYLEVNEKMKEDFKKYCVPLPKGVSEEETLKQMRKETLLSERRIRERLSNAGVKGITYIK